MKILLVVLMSAIILSCTSDKHSDKQHIDFLGADEHVLFSELPEAPRWVLDSEGVFDTNELMQLQYLADSMFFLTGHMCMIHTTESFKPFTSFNEYAYAIDANWGDEGQQYIIIILSIAMVEVRIVNGSKTEQMIPENFTDYIIQKVMIKEFSNDAYFEGIYKSLLQYIEVFNK